MKMFKMLMAFLVFGLLMVPQVHAAQTSLLSAPLNGNTKSIRNTLNNQLVAGQVNAGISDCSLGAASGSLLSTVSVPFNVTSTAALSPLVTGTAPYTAGFTALVTNTGLSTLVAFVNMTSTAITSSNPAGYHVKTLESVEIKIAARDGVTLHLQGLTTTTTANYSICNY